MNEIAAILLVTIAAGSCIPLGGYIASFAVLSTSGPNGWSRSFATF